MSTDSNDLHESGPVPTSEAPGQAFVDDGLVEEEERDDAVIGKAFLWSVVVFLAVGCGVGAFLWANRKVEDVIDAGDPVVPPKVELVTVQLPAIPFVDRTDSAGITFVHQSGATGEKLLPESMGGGCSVLDYDGDGDPDILFVNSKRWDHDLAKLTETTPPGEIPQPSTLSLWRNDGDWNFTEVTEESGLAVSLYGMGSAIGDFDNDGDPDLFVTAVGSNRLFRNDEGKFVDITQSAGVAGAAADWSTSAGWFDSDNDGDLDLFVCNYVEWTREFDLAQPFVLTGDERGYGRPSAFRGALPQLFRNDGEGKFTDISAEAGVQIRNPANDAPLGKSLGVSFADFDGDSRLDIFVSNDTVQNFLFRNLGGNKYEEVGSSSGVGFDQNGVARGAMGTDVAWFRNDDSLGIAVGNFANEMTALYVSLPGTLQFADEAVSNGLGPHTLLELTFGVCWGDFDLDGRLDLLAANGHLENDIHRVQESQTYRQPPSLFWNAGAESRIEFARMTDAELGADFHKPLVGRGSLLADFDLDGDLDILIAACGEKPRLLENQQASGHNWIRFRLEGSRSNRDAVGAIVEVKAGGTTQRRMVSAARSYISQSDLSAHFGLGQATSIDSVTIRWPDGSKETVDSFELNQTNSIRQSQ
ncbi:MAG: CRTAC1 family protein [Planctomycetota bacterium]|nr:CRTAC1 family protein [Planctomycetota bacterium]MDA1251018.1 CRTAC1 family protein [Planctomycetota bacterium]